MSNDKQTQVRVQRIIDAPADKIFEVISNPERHPEIDGSGFVVSDERTDRITANGQVFTMNMSGEHMGGQYQTENHVTGFDENHLLAWRTAPAGKEPPGWEWVWELDSKASDQTEVTLTYDWSHVQDEALLKKINFPLVTEDQLESSLDKLAQAVA